jgi:hypothetical protein
MAKEEEEVTHGGLTRIGREAPDASGNGRKMEPAARRHPAPRTPPPRGRTQRSD